MDDYMDILPEVNRVLGWTRDQFAVARMYYRANEPGHPPADIFGLVIVQIAWGKHHGMDPSLGFHELQERDVKWVRDCFWRVEESEMPFWESLLVRITRIFR